MSEQEHASATHASGPPPRDQEAVATVARRVSFISLNLVGGFFSTEGQLSGLVQEEAADADPPGFGLDASWELAEDGSRLGCLFTIATVFEDEGPYDVMGRFRSVYGVEVGPRLHDAQLEQFVYWNAFFHVWPYWREYLSGLLMRSWVPKFIAPVFRIPGGQAD